VQEGDLVHYPRRGWAATTAEVPFVSADDVADYCREVRGALHAGQISEAFEMSISQTYRILRQLVARGVVTKHAEGGWVHNYTV
jgi:predicted transcriptional regulator